MIFKTTREEALQDLGNYINKETTYYNFFTNFISDLGRTTSHSGDDNTISLSFFIIGM